MPCIHRFVPYDELEEKKKYYRNKYETVIFIDKVEHFKKGKYGMTYDICYDKKKNKKVI